MIEFITIIFTTFYSTEHGKIGEAKEKKIGIRAKI